MNNISRGLTFLSILAYLRRGSRLAVCGWRCGQLGCERVTSGADDSARVGQRAGLDRGHRRTRGCGDGWSARNTFFWQLYS